MRTSVVKIQCWWRIIVAKRICEIEKFNQNQEIIEYWMEQGIQTAPDYAKDLFAGMQTPRR
jgi:hypothetical protein